MRAGTFRGLDLDARAELDIRIGDDLFENGLALVHLAGLAREKKQVEGSHHDLGGTALALILQHREIGGAIGGRGLT